MTKESLNRAEELLDEKNAFLDKQLELIGRVNFNYDDQTTIFLLPKIAELELKLEEIHPTLN